MTKLVVVNKTNVHSSIAFSELTISLDVDVALLTGTTNTLILPLDLVEVSGHKVTGLSFRLPQWAAEAGIVLAGAYEQPDGTVKAVVYSMLGSFTIAKGQPILLAELYEKVTFRQNMVIEAVVKKSHVVQNPANRKPTRRKR